MAFEKRDYRGFSSYLPENNTETLTPLPDNSSLRQIMDQNQFLAKEDIKKRIQEGKLVEANALLSEYKLKYGSDITYYLLRAVAALESGETDIAEQNLFSAQQIAPDQFEVLYLLGLLYEQKEDFTYALEWYQKAKAVAKPGQLQKIMQPQPSGTSLDKVHSGGSEERKLLKIFVRAGFDQFLDDLVEGLTRFYEVEKVIVTSLEQIEPAMANADICWFEWCDEVVMFASKLEIARTKPIVCRLHRYEVFTEFPANVLWERIDTLMLVADHLLDILRVTVPGIEDRVQITTVKNGVAMDKIPFLHRNAGFNIACVGYINMRKNPIMLLQIMEKLVRFDSKYKLFVAGKFQDPLLHIYWEHMVKELGLENNVRFEGWQENITAWLSDKQFLISTSMHESFGYSIAEAMAMGIKPIVHNFPYATRIWPEQVLYNTIDEAVGMITSNLYGSQAYRNFIEEHYSLVEQVTRVRQVLSQLPKEKASEVKTPMFEDGALKKRVAQLVSSVATDRQEEVLQ